MTGRGVLSGTWYTATAALPMMLMPKAKFAQYASGLIIILSVLTMMIGLVTGMVLDATRIQLEAGRSHLRYTRIAGGVCLGYGGSIGNGRLEWISK